MYDKNHDNAASLPFYQAAKIENEDANLEGMDIQSLHFGWQIIFMLGEES